MPPAEEFAKASLQSWRWLWKVWLPLWRKTCLHLDVGGAQFRKFAELIELSLPERYA
jgi:hypothetical protein